jgi:hypothetical protein
VLSTTWARVLFGQIKAKTLLRARADGGHPSENEKIVDENVNERYPAAR